MIDVKQIKAARVLLDWNQDDLARKSGMSKAAIANIERGSASPRQDTLDILQETFEIGGVAFLQPSGVQLVGERFDLKVWEGKDYFFKLWADIAKTFSDGSGGILHIANVSDAPVAEKFPQEVLGYIKKMDALKVERRILISEEDSDILVAQPQWYRQIPKVLFNQTPYYVYGDKVVFLFFELQKIVRIENINMARGFKSQFDYSWNQGKKLEKYTVLLK